jgi:hypothetical protein
MNRMKTSILQKELDEAAFHPALGAMISFIERAACA